MMSHELITLSTIYFIALLSPGQDFFLILSTSLSQGYAKAWWNCAGIALGNALYIVLAFIGHTLFSQSFLFIYIKLGGALFLIYLGYVLIMAPKPINNHNSPKAHDHWRLFFQGFFSALLNPKNIIFYFSVLFTIISIDTSWSLKIFYTLWMVFLLLVWDMSIAFIFGNKRAKILLPYLYPLQKIIGIVLVSFGMYEIYTF